MKVVYRYQDANNNLEESKVNSDNRNPRKQRRERKGRNGRKTKPRPDQKTV